MAKLNRGLNIYYKFLNFIYQIYLNVFLASKFFWFYFIWIKYNDNQLHIYIISIGIIYLNFIIYVKILM
jgi:hypothetical protein